MFRFDLKRKHHDDVTERKELRTRLQCKNFQWYLEHVYPELEVPDDNYIAAGEVRTQRLSKYLRNKRKFNFLLRKKFP